MPPDLKKIPTIVFFFFWKKKYLCNPKDEPNIATYCAFCSVGQLLANGSTVFDSCASRDYWCPWRLSAMCWAHQNGSSTRPRLSVLHLPQPELSYIRPGTASRHPLRNGTNLHAGTDQSAAVPLWSVPIESPTAGVAFPLSCFFLVILKN